MQNSYGLLRRGTGWLLFVSPVCFLFWLWCRYAILSDSGIVLGVLVSCQTVSGPFAWLLVEIHPWPPAGLIFAVLALGLVGGYSWIIWRTAFGGRWVLLHPLLSLAWCLVGFFRTAPYV